MFQDNIHSYFQTDTGVVLVYIRYRRTEKTHFYWHKHYTCFSNRTSIYVYGIKFMIIQQFCFLNMTWCQVSFQKSLRKNVNKWVTALAIPIKYYDRSHLEFGDFVHFNSRHLYSLVPCCLCQDSTVSETFQIHGTVGCICTQISSAGFSRFCDFKSRTVSSFHGL